MGNDLSNPDTLFELAEWYHERGLYEAAICRYRRVLDLMPDCDITLNNLGSSYHEMGRYSDALECTRQAIDLDPKVGLYHYNYATSLYGKDGSDTRAIRDYLMDAVFLDPKLADLEFTKAWLTAKEIRECKFKAKKSALPWLFAATLAGAGISNAAQQNKNKQILQAKRVNS